MAISALFAEPISFSFAKPSTILVAKSELPALAVIVVIKVLPITVATTLIKIGLVLG